MCVHKSRHKLDSNCLDCCCCYCRCRFDSFPFGFLCWLNEELIEVKFGILIRINKAKGGGNGSVICVSQDTNSLSKSPLSIAACYVYRYKFTKRSSAAAAAPCTGCGIATADCKYICHGAGRNSFAVYVCVCCTFCWLIEKCT